MGIAALPHWVVESFERQGLVVTKTWAKDCGAGYIRRGTRRRTAPAGRPSVYSLSAETHACDHLPFVRVRSDPASMDPQ